MLHALATLAGAAVGTIEQTLSSRTKDAALEKRLVLATQAPPEEQNQSSRLLDVRSSHAFSKEHLAGAVNIPLSELRERSGELPPSASGSIHVLCDPGDEGGVQAVLLPEHQGNGRNGGWAIADLLVASSALWVAARRLGVTETGMAHGRFMWRPSPHLPRVVAELERLVPPDARRAVDLGCGKGRDAICEKNRHPNTLGPELFRAPQNSCVAEPPPPSYRGMTQGSRAEAGTSRASTTSSAFSPLSSSSRRGRA
jgi:rhodanese-related sulfurtransferase